MNVPPLRQRPAWALLQAHYQTIKGLHFRQVFAQEPDRGERLSAEAAGIYLDYSKNRITAETLQFLLQLAKESDLRGRIEAMFQGEAINVSEERAVLHVALRAPRGATIVHHGRNVVPDVWTAWLIFPIGYAAAYGRDTLASASAMS
jgi:glucose-6-phosphate isomerase